MAGVLLLNTEIFQDSAVFEKAFADVSDRRKEKILSCRQKKDRLLSLGAGVLLDRALSAYGLREKDMAITAGPYGKPAFSDGKPFAFSLSHSGERALLAVSDSTVGCDIEKIREIDLRIADRFFSESENAYIRTAAGKEEAKRRFFRVWVRKESYLKALGTGIGNLNGNFDTVEKEGKTLPVTVNERAYAFSEYSADGYEAAVCLPAGEKCRFHIITLSQAVEI